MSNSALFFVQPQTAAAIIGAAALMFTTVFAGWLGAGSKQPAGVEIVNLGGRPFVNAAKVESLAVAQSRLPFEMPLPEELTGEWEPVTIWAPKEAGSPHGQARIEFANGTELHMFPSKEPNFAAIASTNPDLVLVPVGERVGLADDPEIKRMHGGELEEPGVVGWWQHGYNIDLYSHEHSKAELVEMAKLFVR